MIKIQSPLLSLFLNVLCAAIQIKKTCHSCTPSRLYSVTRIMSQVRKQKVIAALKPSVSHLKCS